MWTDDTHMSLYLADALLSVASQNFSPNALGEAIGQAFSKWYEDPLTPSTAPGNTCLEGVKNYIESGNWETCGIQNSDGCGAVIHARDVEEPRGAARLAVFRQPREAAPHGHGGGGCPEKTHVVIRRQQPAHNKYKYAHKR